MINPSQVRFALLDGTIDGIQVHVCQNNSYVKLYKNAEVIDTIKGDANICRPYRREIQDVHELRSTEIFLDKKIEDYRCLCFDYDGKKYCCLLKGVSAHLNMAELFSMKAEYRNEISLIEKVTGLRIHFPVKNNDPI